MTKAPMPTARNGLATAVVHDRIYAIGGYNGSSLSTVEGYNPVTNTWRTVAPMPMARVGFGSVAVNGFLYAIGGWNGNRLSTVEEYNPVTDTWRVLAPMPTARAGLVAVAVNDRIYAIGGSNNNSYLSTVEGYNPVTNTWRMVAPMPTARENLEAATVADRIYAIGGYNDSYLSTVEEYNPITNTWRVLAPMPTARRYLAAAAVKNRIYAIGGYNDSYLSTVEAYIPIPDLSYRVDVNLSAGLNMIALPLQPDTPLTASTLATMLGATLVIRFDTTVGRFVPFIRDNQAGEDFPIEMGQGYIINLLAAKAHVWEGKAWGDPVPQAPPSAPLSDTWAFVVAGQLEATDWTARHLHQVAVTNRRTGETVRAPIRASDATFAAVFADLNRRPVVGPGDVLEIQVMDRSGNLVTSPIQRHVDADAIQRAYLLVNIDQRNYPPTRSALFQNYPNPFNPETWMPFQLVEEANVEISIYNAAGQVVRRLPLGHRPAGSYLRRERAGYWDGRDERGQLLPSGLYFYHLRAGDFSQTRKMGKFRDTCKKSPHLKKAHIEAGLC